MMRSIHFNLLVLWMAPQYENTGVFLFDVLKWGKSALYYEHRSHQNIFL